MEQGLEVFSFLMCTREGLKSFCHIIGDLTTIEFQGGYNTDTVTIFYENNIIKNISVYSQEFGLVTQSEFTILAQTFKLLGRFDELKYAVR